MEQGPFMLPKEFTPAIHRLAGYNKNVSQIIPQNQQNYNQGTPAQFFLPQAIIDIRSLVLYFTAALTMSGGTAIATEVQTAYYKQAASMANQVATAGTFRIIYNGVSCGPFAFNQNTDTAAAGANITYQLNNQLFGIPIPNSAVAVPANSVPIIVGPTNQAGLSAQSTLTFTFSNTAYTPGAGGSFMSYVVGPQATLNSVTGQPLSNNPNLLISLDTTLLTPTTAPSTTFTLVTTAWAGSGIALPRNIESMIDRYEFVVGGQNIHTGSVQYGTLFTDYLNQNTSSEFLAQRTVAQNAGPLNYLWTGAAGTVNSQTFSISSWLGFLGSKCILDTRKMPQVIIRIYFSQPTILIPYSTGSPSYVLTGSTISGASAGVYMDCDVLEMPPLYDDLIDMKMNSEEGLEIPYMNWYSTEQSNPTSAISDFRFSFETQCLTDIIAIIRNSTYAAQATLDPVTGNADYFKYELRGLGSYAWNIFGKNYPEYYIPAPYALEQTLKALGKLSHVDCGTLYSTLYQYLHGYYSIRTSFEHVGQEMGYQSGLNTLGGLICQA